MSKPNLTELSSLEKLRHSAAHLLAAAVLELWPDTKITIGPPVENGFYYDFEFNQPISDADLSKIEKRMHKIIPSWTSFAAKEVSLTEAQNLFQHNPYKLELIKDIAEKNEKITLHTSGEFADLCRGGHVENPNQELKYFKLLSVAGAYWRGNENNTMLTRIYGTIFPSQTELDAYLTMLEEAKKRDHKKLGKELGLFTFSELVGPGLPMFTPKGTIVRDELENYIAQLNKKYNYQKVWIPHITKVDLYKTSGHWEKFADDLFHVKGVNDDFALKPMNCPHHTQIYASEARSYKDLPIRFHETTTVYRDEKSGQLGGLTRVRCITQDDGHTFLMPSQIEAEFDTLLTIQKQVLQAVGLNEYWISLSLRDPKNKDKYLGDDAVWEEAQSTMENILKKKNITYKAIEGEAAFYGPKMDLMAKDSIGREWQLSTIQLDFNMPKRFELEYTAEDGSKQIPVMVHRAFMGSTERFMGVIIEHFAGALPLWLSPIQMNIVSVGGDHKNYCEKLAEEFKQADIRVAVDNSDESVGKKIRNSSSQKIPYTLVVGDKEMNSDNLSVRVRGQEELMEISKQEFIDKIKFVIAEKGMGL